MVHELIIIKNSIAWKIKTLGRCLGPLLKTGLPLIENALKPFAKGILI